MKKDTTTRATLLTLFAYFLWGFSFLFSRLGMDEARPFVLIAHRFTLALAAMGLMMATGRQSLHLRGKRVRRLLLMGLCEPGIYFAFEAYGILYTTTAFSGVMLATVPIISLFGSALLLHERITSAQLIWSLVSVGGVVVYTLYGGSEGSISLLGVLCLLVAVLSTVGFTLLSRSLAEEFTPFERTFISTAEGAVIYWPLAMLQCRDDLTALIAPLASGRYCLSVAFLGIANSIVCYGLLNYALGRMPVSRVAIGTNLVTVVSIFAGVVFLHEPFSWMSLLCSLVILLGIYGVERAPAPPDKPARHDK